MFQVTSFVHAYCCSNDCFPRLMDRVTVKNYKKVLQKRPGFIQQQFSEAATPIIQV